MTRHANPAGYQIGQSLPPPAPRAAPFGAECQPAWFCLTPRATAAAHKAGREFFSGYNMRAFYPSEERWTKRRDDKGRKVMAEVPIVTGYLWVQVLRAPLWHVIKTEKWCAGVFKIGDTVIEFPYAVIRHLQGLTVGAVKVLKLVDVKILERRDGHSGRLR